MLESNRSADTRSQLGSLFIVGCIAASLWWVVGWGIRENQAIKEMKEDPIWWASRLPLHKQAVLKEYLKNIPDGLANPVSVK